MATVERTYMAAMDRPSDFEAGVEGVEIRTGDIVVKVRETGGGVSIDVAPQVEGLTLARIENAFDAGAFSLAVRASRRPAEVGG